VIDRLRSALTGRTPGRPMLIGPSLALTSAEVLERVAALNGLRLACAGRHVAIWLRHPIDAAIVWMALDGAARQLLLIPADTSEALAQDFAQRSGSTHWVGDAVGLAGCERLHTEALHAVDAPPDAEDTHWLLTTSGTTGTPKLVPHTLASLAATARRDFSQGEALRWGLLYDPSRFAGLQVMFQALLGGSSLVCTPSSTPFEERLGLFAEAGVNALSATPTLWRKLLMSGIGARLSLKLATLGGEIADQKVLDAVRDAFPQARVRHVYASTEAGVGFSVTDGLEGFSATWLKSPPPGVELRISDGELLLRSARTAIGYQGGDALRGEDEWVASGDRVESDGSRVRFAGRINGAINVGGDKVFPETVERVLMSHAGVAGASVRAKKSVFSGALVEALVMPAPGVAGDLLLRQELLALCNSKLPKYAVPALFKFVGELAANSSGKQDRSS
jgi:acyl-CoA synthetase (AMP-forming)/AMP-acid ligase II